MQDSEIIVIGGGIVGLATAVELRQLGADVTVLSRDFKAAAGHAAAGMLAPQAERIPSGAMLDLCAASLALYPEWVQKIEAISGVNPHYWQCGILAPHYNQPLDLADDWVDARSIHHIQPQLSDAVIGGYWYPADGQVDNRSLMQSLWIACQSLGVKLMDGVEVRAIHRNQDRVVAVETDRGKVAAGHYILATGAWTQELLPIPVVPRKGQLLSLQVPQDRLENLPLQQVLFGEEIYIVPRQDGRIVVGATSEDVGFAPHNTVAGIDRLLTTAMRLVPFLRELPIQSMWWGFRPATPDELPILGRSMATNLTLATGHYRNGILLAPITAKLIAKLVWQQQVDELLTAFSWNRFDP